MTTPTTESRGIGNRRIIAIAENIPPIFSFSPVDAIPAMFEQFERLYPSVVRTRRIGTSRLGEPILLTSVGTGDHNAMVVAGVHPNEVVGFLTAYQLMQLLVTDPAIQAVHGFTWHFVQNMDPDGTRLNEPWFAAPGDRALYALNFFRPAPEQQPEWTFPTSYKRAYFDRMLPESQAVARAIDEVSPELYVSLHNSETGGAYWFVTDADSTVVNSLHGIAQAMQIPVDRGEAESPHLRRVADGVFLASRFSDDYDAAEAQGEDPAIGFCGTSSTEYAARGGAVTLIPEVPYWRPIDTDVRETDEPYAAMLRRTAKMMEDLANHLVDLLARAERHVSIDSPFLEAARAFIPMMAADAESDLVRAVREESATPRVATTAETASRETRVRGFALRYGGMLRRALEVELLAGLAGIELRRCAAEVDAVFDDWLKRGDPIATAPIPVERLVGVQLGSILALADHVATSRVNPGDVADD